MNRVKLESIGSLTGGIAHDFNNLLTVISGNLSLLQTSDTSDDEVLEDAKKAAADGAELVRSLLAFSRQQQLAPRWHEIRYLLKEFNRSVVRSIRDDITLDIQKPGLKGSVFVDRTQFEAALLNLCINAADAIVGPGEITICSSLRATDPDLLREFSLTNSRAEQFVLVQVSDTGCGISPQDIAKITTPFYTTKQGRGGTGLGLSSVKGFVEQSGGGMCIRSELGKGTSVQLLLPYSERPADRPSLERSQRRRGLNPGNGRCILVVDDEPGVRRLVSRWLSQRGYRVLEAGSGDEALELMGTLGESVDIIFSDLVMPGTNDGLALAEQVAERWPHVGVLLSTGYDQDRRFHADGNEPIQFPVISKPYDLNDLGAAINEQFTPRR